MEPDGKLVIELLETPTASTPKAIEILFKGIKHWHAAREGIVIAYASGRMCYPWHRIWRYNVVNNSEAFQNTWEDRVAVTCVVDNHRFCQPHAS